MRKAHRWPLQQNPLYNGQHQAEAAVAVEGETEKIEEERAVEATREEGAEALILRQRDPAQCSKETPTE